MTQIPTLPDELNQQIIKFIKQKLPSNNLTDFAISPLTPDGSERLYYRINYPSGAPFIAVDGRGTGLKTNHPSGLSQNQTFIHIRNHLAKLDFPVPELYSRSQSSDFYLLQDLGDVTLYQIIKEQGWNHHTVALYKDVLSLLLRLQTTASDKFDQSWCYAGGYYNRQLILDHELNYFLNAFVTGYCGVEINHATRQKLETEFFAILDAAATAPADFFLYRDFQSKNLMLKEEQVYLIDFQGARLGPYYYDLAALINDPYTDIPWPLRDQLCSDYYHKLYQLLKKDAPSQESFNYLFTLFSLIRTLQTLGAFGYLTSKQKLHFKVYIKPALKNLRHYLNKLSDHHNLQTLKILIKSI